jgi:hypothetical protein
MNLIIRDLWKVAVHWIAIPLWILVAPLTITILGHGCVACNEWTDDGCMQRMEGTSYIIRLDTGADPIVSRGDTPTEAWDNAPPRCDPYKPTHK